MSKAKREPKAVRQEDRAQRAAKFLRALGWEVWPESGKQERKTRWIAVQPEGSTYKLPNYQLIDEAERRGLKDDSTDGH